MGGPSGDGQGGVEREDARRTDRHDEGPRRPLLGLFGNDDRAPSPEQVNQHETALKKHGKMYEFQRYDGAGHGFFYWHRPLYRPEQAMDGWSKIFAFFGKYLAK